MLRSGSSTRLAEDAAARERAVASRRSCLGLAALVDRDEAAHQRDDEGHADHHELRPEPAVGPGLPGDPLGFGSLFAVPFLAAGGDEVAFAGREQAGPGLGHLDRDLELGSAVQRPRVTVELDPAGRRLPQVAEHHQGVAVLVDPAAKAWPLPEEGLVGDLHRRARVSADGGPG